MHARVTFTHAKVDRVDEAIQMYQDLQPLVRERKGLTWATLLMDRNSGEGIAISLWETETDMLTVETSGVYEQVMDRFAGVFSAPSEMNHYEVAVQMVI